MFPSVSNNSKKKGGTYYLNLQRFPRWCRLFYVSKKNVNTFNCLFGVATMQGRVMATTAQLVINISCQAPAWASEPKPAHHCVPAFAATVVREVNGNKTVASTPPKNKSVGRSVVFMFVYSCVTMRVARSCLRSPPPATTEKKKGLAKRQPVGNHSTKLRP